MPRYFQKTLENSEVNPSEPGDLLDFTLYIILPASSIVIDLSNKLDSSSESLYTSDSLISFSNFTL